MIHDTELVFNVARRRRSCAIVQRVCDVLLGTVRSLIPSSKHEN